jgi:hypothetical protein
MRGLMRNPEHGGTGYASQGALETINTVGLLNHEQHDTSATAETASPMVGYVALLESLRRRYAGTRS